MSHRMLDVIVLGGGLAGSLLARQLKLTKPELSLALLEQDAERRFKVGESTVEIAANYLLRKQKLSRYLYLHQLPKNSLRFFFDKKQKNAPLTSMSEIGVYHLPPLPSFQLDRARLETDLLQMNEELGVDVRIGAKVLDVALDGRDGHRVRFAQSGETLELRGKWVIDAMGRASTIARAKETRRRTPEHHIAAVWGRLTGVADIDAWPDEEWRKKARYTARSLSTNHFCYDGYWIWFIPLSCELVSVGIVSEAERFDPRWRGREGFLTELRRHGAVASMLGNAELVDLGSYAQLSYGSKLFFAGKDRWGFTGESAAFSDPFYSPGSDFIAIENDMLTDLIVRDFAGEDIEERSGLYDAMMQFRFDNTMQLYSGLYPTLGSFELFRQKCYFDCASYYNVWVDPYMQDLHLDVRWIRTQLRRKDFVLEAMRNFNRLFASTAHTLRRDGSYWRQNLGHSVLNGVEAFGVFEGLGQPRNRREVNERTEQIFNTTRMNVLKILDPSEAESVPLERFMGDVDLRTLRAPE